MRFPRYGNYTQPEADWLGELPSHWDVRRTKTMFTLQNSKVGKTSADHALLSLTLGGVIVRDLDEGGKLPAEFDSYQMVKPRDLVFCLFDIDETPRTIGISRNHGMITGAYSVYRSLPPCVPEYACYYFLHLDSFKGLRPFYTGLRKVVRSDTFSKVEMPAPPLDEQKQIAAFLDYETAKIDALIEKQQQLIALLGEKRQAVISHAVTKGLNPNAPMRDSGIEWLGGVPEHWEIKRLKHLFRSPLRNGVSPETAESGGICTFSIAAVRNGIVDVANHIKYAAISKAAACPYLVEHGDLMMMRGNGSRDLVGSVGIVQELPSRDCIYPDILIRLRFSEKIDTQFAVLFINSLVCRPQIAMGAKTSAGIWKVSGATVAEFVIPLPPKNEQALIRDYLENVLSKLDSLMEIAESQNVLLQERRTALISAAVTGKIDVRGWKRPPSDAKVESEMDVA